MNPRCRFGFVLAGLLALSPVPLLRAQAVSFKTVQQDVLLDRLKQAAATNKERWRTLAELFSQSGCPQLAEQTAKGLSTPNVVCTLPGAEPAMIVVGAHFDKVAAGDGVIDNWSGASLLPSLLVSLNNMPRRLTFVFVGFSEEETGLRGSSAYVKQFDKTLRANIKAMVNLDCLGLGPIACARSGSHKELVESLLRVIRAVNVPFSFVNVDQVGRSDAQSFASKRIPVIDFHSITQPTLSVLHSNRDNIAAVSAKDYEDSYRLIAAFLAYLDATWAKPASETTQ
jgi:Zn-dependent M28 family amino/carboxypeptidase